MKKHTPKEMIVSGHALWSDAPLCSHVRMAVIQKHAPANGLDADHLTAEFARRWNCHKELFECLQILQNSARGKKLTCVQQKLFDRIEGVLTLCK